VERNAKLEEMYPGIVRAEDLAKDEPTRQLIKAALAPNAMARPFAAPAGVPPARLQALRDAFWAAFQDPGFIADAEQAKLELSPNRGERTAEIVNEVLSLSPELAKRLKEIRAG
jgi:hypothetical protein